MKREFEAYRNSSNRRAFYGIINKSNKRCGDQIRNSNGKRYNDPEQWYHKGRKMVWSSGNRRYNGPTNPCYMRDDNRRIFWQNIYELDSGGFFDKLLDIESNNGQIQALLTDIGKDITGRLESKFDLGRNNASYTIKSVTVAGNNRTNYEKEGRYLIFTGNQLPEDDQQIIVRYNDSSDGAQRSYDRTFSLDHRPDPDTVKVKVDDNSLQKNGNWRVSGNTIELLATTDDMIKQITPSGARIVVEYKRRPEDVAKERVFNLPNNNRYIPPSSVQVAKGCGRNYTGSGFSINGRTVTFDSGNEPDHGQRVCFRYNEVTNTYQYSFPVVQGATGFSCAKGGIAVSCQYNSGQILFTNANQFSADVNGTRVDVSYTKPKDSAFVAALDERCVKDSVTLSSGSITCDSGQLVFNGNELDLAQADTQKCSFLKNPTIGQEMTLSCRADDQTFIIDDPELKIRRGDYKIEVWEVTNKCQPMTEFTIDENDYTLSFAKYLDDNCEIAVTISFMN